MYKNINEIFKDLSDWDEGARNKEIIKEMHAENVIAEMLFEVLDYEEKGEGFAEYCHQTAKQIIDGVYSNLQEIQDELDDIFETEKNETC